MITVPASLARIQAAGKLAGRTGQLHTVNPHAETSEEALVWFHSWHLAVIEKEEGEKILVGENYAHEDLMICRRSAVGDDL